MSNDNHFKITQSILDGDNWFDEKPEDREDGSAAMKLFERYQNRADVAASQTANRPPHDKKPT